MPDQAGLGKSRTVRQLKAGVQGQKGSQKPCDPGTELGVS